MPFGWFARKPAADKTLAKARKLVEQCRWAEALTYFEDAGDGDEARQGAQECRTKLVEWNLEEARAYTEGDPGKAREHAELAATLAVGDAGLLAAIDEVLAGIHAAHPPVSATRRERLFAPSCGASCGGGSCGDHDHGEPVEDGELFEFYLDSLSPAERAALEPLGEPFREGFVLLQQGDLEGALPKLKAAVKAAPRAVGPVYAMGLLAAVGQAPEVAEKNFLKALEIDPGFAPAALHRAALLREKGKPKDAAAFLTRWLAAHPGEGEVRVLLAACHLEAGDPQAALEAAQAAETECPEDNPSPKLLRGQALRRLGHLDQALGAFQAVAAKKPDLLDALIPLGQILIEKGGPSAERAVQVFKKCHRQDPDHGWWHLLRVAEAYGAWEKPKQAAEALARAQEELPEAPEAQREWTEVRQRLAG